MSALLLIAATGMANLAKAQSAERYNIIPQPETLTPQSGDFQLTNGTTIYAKKAEAVGRFFAAKLSKATGYNIQLTNKKTSGGIQLLIDKKVKGEEAYELSVTPEGVTAKASTEKGLFYAMQSFLQLLPAQVESEVPVSGVAWKAAACQIQDKPRFDYRGTLIDVCRHFFPLSQLKKHIDMMSMYKINNLHLHLTEDQAWRIEIKKYPKLTEVGSWRRTEYGRTGGFYTQEEMKELVKYAEERFVNIIPEFEVPGHELAAIAAYPWLSCRDLKVEPRRTWGVEPIITCAGKETTFQFYRDVVDELVKIFPSKLFHIGGDEAPRIEWKSCPHCQAKADELGLKDENGRSREAQLQSYVVREMEKYLNKYGKDIIGWDEILEGGDLNKSAIVMSWRGETGGIAAANAGHRVITTPGSGGLYVDHFQGEPALEPQGIGGYAPLSKTYGYEPIPQAVAEKGMGQYVMGPQVNLWAEYLPDNDRQDYRLYPRMLALSEVGWSQKEKKNFEDFSRRLDTDASIRMKLHHVNFHIPLPQQPEGSFDFVAFTDQKAVAFETTRPEKMVYTLDGSNPTPQSTTYTAPIIFDKSGTIKIATVLPTGDMSRIRTIRVEKQQLSPAAAVEGTQLGLKVQLVKGTYLKTQELANVTEWDNSRVIKNLAELTKLGSEDYAAIASGYVKVEKDGVYYVRSNNVEVWIDGQKVVDNNNTPVKTSEPNGGSIALKAGLHQIKVVYINTIMAGRPADWGGSRIHMRYGEKGGFPEVKAEELFHI